MVGWMGVGGRTCGSNRRGAVSGLDDTKITGTGCRSEASNWQGLSQILPAGSSSAVKGDAHLLFVP